MTIKAAVFAILDNLQERDISGWQLFNMALSATGRKTYPATLLQYAREYAALSGAEFYPVDAARSTYRYVPGTAINGAIRD